MAKSKETDANNPVPYPISFKIEGQDYFSGAAIEFDGGWLVSYSQGEFGSHIYWFSNDSKTQKRITRGYHINKFISSDGVVYGIGGFSHGLFSNGYIIKISNEGAKIQTEEFYSCDSPFVDAHEISPSEILCINGYQT